MSSRVAVVLSVGVVLVGCNALLGTEESKGGSARAPEGDSGTDDAGDASTASGETGPGPLGALPSGYCCTSDSECRARHCVAVGSGGKMCLDSCDNDDYCTRARLAFVCSSGTPRGWCEPPSPSFQCIPQAQFVRGSLKSGDCCAVKNNGTNGEECEGNRCGPFGMDDTWGPDICTQWCDGDMDCPSTMECLSNVCVPLSVPSYTCQ